MLRSRLAGLMAAVLGLVVTMTALTTMGSIAAPSTTNSLPVILKGQPLGIPHPVVGNATMIGTSQSAVVWSGTSVPGSLVNVFPNENCTNGTFTGPAATVTTNFAGQWSAPVTVPNPQTGSAWSFSANMPAPNNWLVSGCNPEIRGVYGAPLLQGTTPPSPSNNLQPIIYGSGRPSPNATRNNIQVFTNANCAGAPVAIGSVGLGADGQVLSDPSRFEIRVTVPPNSTTNFWANLRDFRVDDSPCSSALSTVPGFPPSGPPVNVTYQSQGGQVRGYIQGSNPSPPSNNPTPQLFGTADPGNVGQQILLFNNASCSGSGGGQVGTGIIDGNNFWTITSATITQSTTFFVSIPNTTVGVPVCSAGFFYAFTGGGGGTPTLNGASGQGQFPTFSGNAPPGSVVYLYRGACQASLVNGQSFADGNGFYTVVPATAVTSPATFFVNAQINGSFTPCSTGLFYSP